MSDKVAEWEARIAREPREEVANIEYLELLYECRILDARLRVEEDE